jgi:hypothetical protein
LDGFETLCTHAAPPQVVWSSTYDKFGYIISNKLGPKNPTLHMTFHDITVRGQTSSRGGGRERRVLYGAKPVQGEAAVRRVGTFLTMNKPLLIITNIQHILH